MKQRQLGKDGPMVGEVGFGAMSFGGIFGPTDVATSHRTLDRCLDFGVTHIDTALIYGPHISEEVIGAYFRKNPTAEKRFSIATKGGFRINSRGISNEAGFMRECLEGSLRRLGVEHIDLYYIHRRDQSIPIETVTETLVGFVREGKIGGIGFSEISPASLERASKVHHVRAVQSEYSLWSRLPELGMLQACKRLGTAFVAFSPLARGVLTNTVLDPKTLPDDFRPNMPRFTEANHAYNMAYVERFKVYAKSKGWSPSALALAWVMQKGEHVIAIPGTRTPEHLAENVAAADINLSADDVRDIESILPAGFAQGHRYSDEQQKSVEQYC